ncbi:XRE family transcriptional regulator [Pseudoalteromonas sp. OANN1]|uniref:helix-turn-helix domain-containing protein n=1 Tax=Pseudoalteromonas sp. OANN1 TaxID=2954497 RepID=UPI0020974142|nr:XRE family transcriptional regulator [Pseudoalteromonas sp. OANN1]MCO7197568.1 XRE family transcriptional regulator [Pseudoalteromonas sp. OANN1]
MKVKSEISKNLGVRLKDIRKERGLSLDKLANMTGISKAMLGQIERFESSPTVELLWKLAQGIGIEYTMLLDPSDPQNSNNSINQEGSIFAPVYSSNGSKNTEVFVISLIPNDEHLREPHDNVAEELVHVLEGQLEVFYDGAWHLLKTDQKTKFSAAQKHGYRALDSATKFINVIVYK